MRYVYCSSEKLPLETKVAYALGGPGNAIGRGTIIPFWCTFFLTDIARLDLGFISIFWVIVTAWNALSHPPAAGNLEMADSIGEYYLSPIVRFPFDLG